MIFNEINKINSDKYIDIIDKLKVNTIESIKYYQFVNLNKLTRIVSDKKTNNKSIEEFLLKFEIILERHTSSTPTIEESIDIVKEELKYIESEYLIMIEKNKLEDFCRVYLTSQQLKEFNLNLNHIKWGGYISEIQNGKLNENDIVMVFITKENIFVATCYSE